MRIGITSDHGGYDLKNKIIENFKEEIEIIDYGTNSKSVDYPDFAFILGESIIKKEIDYGIAICKTGIGMSIALNKIKGIYCAKIDNEKDVYCSKNHNGINAIAIRGDLSFDTAKEIIKNLIIDVEEIEYRHELRIDKIRKYENEH